MRVLPLVRPARALAVLVVLVVAAPAVAAPARCDAGIGLGPTPAKLDGSVTGKVVAIKTDALGAQVTLAPAFDFTVLVPDHQTLPFARNDTISLAYHCGGGHQIVCDVRLADAKGATLILAHALGTNQDADGWTATPGAVTRSRQNPNTKQTSIEHTLALTLAKGSLHATVSDAGCTEIKDGNTTWLASGFAVRWEGVRPPEGIDYQQFALWRKH